MTTGLPPQATVEFLGPYGFGVFLLAVLGVFLSATGALAFARHRLVRRAAGTTPSTIGPGPVAVEGTTAPAGTPLLPPLAQRPSVWYDLSVSTRTKRLWHEVAHRRVDPPFLLSDGETDVVVDPSGADVQPGAPDVRSGQALQDVPTDLEPYLPQDVVAGEARFRERSIPVGVRLTIVANAVEENGHLVIRAGSGASLVSRRPARAVARDYALQAVLCLGAGSGIFALAFHVLAGA